MKTIRRLYLYAVIYISLETVLWGMIRLIRWGIAGADSLEGITRLAQGFSLALVGIPVFLLHWWWAQREARQGAEARFTFIRPIFLYLVLLSTLIPVAQNALAGFTRQGMHLLNLGVEHAWIGADQTNLDNLIAILVNLLAAAYFFYILRLDWRQQPAGEAFPVVRRLVRFIWLACGLAYVLAGAQQLLWAGLNSRGFNSDQARAALANGMALLLVGAPLLGLIQWRIQRSLSDTRERFAMLRLGALYLLAFIGVGVAFISIAWALQDVISWLTRASLGMELQPNELPIALSQSLPLALPFGTLWLYYGRILITEIRVWPETEAGGGKIGQRRAGLRRLYDYLLIFLSLMITFIGLARFLASLLNLTVGSRHFRDAGVIFEFAHGVSLLIVGIPLWLSTWHSAQREAGSQDEAGAEARQSLVRRIYLYAALFSGVIGVMFSCGGFLYPLLRALLGDVLPDLGLQTLQQLRLTLLFGALLIYHWHVLRGDACQLQQTLERSFEQFPVLVLAPKESEFTRVVKTSLESAAPGLPVMTHSLDQEMPQEVWNSVRAVILPGKLVVNPPETLQRLLQDFQGHRLVIPDPGEGWVWLGIHQSLPSLARQAAQMVTHLAKGELPAQPRAVPAWLALVYVSASLFAVQLAVLLLVIIFSFLQR